MQYVLGQNLTPRQAFTILLPVIISLGIKVVCGPLLNNLMVASTKHGTNAQKLKVLVAKVN